MSAQPEALRLADELEQFRNDATPGKWGKGMTTHETVATQTDGSKYHVADFRHAADAAFVDMAHRQARGIATELRRLHAENEANERNLCQLTDELAKTVALLRQARQAAQIENEELKEWKEDASQLASDNLVLIAENAAKDALLRQAWAVIRWQCFGECRTEGVEGLPTPSEVDAAIREHLNK